MQYTAFKPIMAVVIFALSALGLYEEGNFSADSSYLYITILYNFSISAALYFLVLFYEGTKPILKAYKPLQKFLCIKSVIFFAFWQSVLIATLSHFGLIVPMQGFESWTASDIAGAANNAILCVEMFPCALAFAYTFGYLNFKDDAVSDRFRDLLQRFGQVANISDVAADAMRSLKVEAIRNISVLPEFLAAAIIEKKIAVLHQGWMTKRGEDLTKRWTKRFFVLIRHPLGLVYFKHDIFDASALTKDERDLEAKGFLDVSKILEIKKTERGFDVITRARTWHFKTGPKEVDEWIGVLEMAMRISKRHAEAQAELAEKEPPKAASPRPVTVAPLPADDEDSLHSSSLLSSPREVNESHVDSVVNEVLAAVGRDGGARSPWQKLKMALQNQDLLELLKKNLDDLKHEYREAEKRGDYDMMERLKGEITTTREQIAVFRLARREARAKPTQPSDNLCKYCDAPMGPSDTFCIECGHRVKRRAVKLQNKINNEPGGLEETIHTDKHSKKARKRKDDEKYVELEEIELE